MSGHLRCTRSSCLRAFALVGALCTFASVASSNEVAMHRIVDIGSLGQSPNSVDLELLLNEWKGALPTNHHDQLS